MQDKKIVVWFSCGAASAVAAKLTIEKYAENNTVCVVNHPVMEEDPDNRRFLLDVEKWIGQSIEIAASKKYPSNSANEVWEKERFMSSRFGAPCTRELKRMPGQDWERINKPDYLVLGFTADEKKRHDRFVLTERGDVLPILIDAGIKKVDCFRIIRTVGIKLPNMYRLGYPNANCIGCVKVSSPTYWNHVRKVHPEVFAQRAKLGRELGCRLVEIHSHERIFLDELPEDARGRPMKNIDFACGRFCEENPNE